jgi:hypothetical protein
MSQTILWGDDLVPVLQRDWTRHALRLPYRKTYRLKTGERWHDAPTTDAQWEHYVELADEVVPAGAVIARELNRGGCSHRPVDGVLGWRGLYVARLRGRSSRRESSPRF